MRPEFRIAQPEIGTRCRLVPEYLVLQLVGLRIVVNDEALKVLRALVHDLAERIKIRKHPRILVIEFAAIADDILAQNKHVVNVGTQRRWNPHGVLHRDNEHGVHVPTIHEEIADIAIPDPRGIKQTVIQNQEVSGIYYGVAVIRQILGNLLGNEFLPLEHIRDDERRILLVDKHGGDNLAVELVGSLRAGNDRSTRQGLVVPQEILDQKGLAGLPLTNEDHHLVVLDLAHIKFAEFEVETPGSRLRHCLDKRVENEFRILSASSPVKRNHPKSQ